MIWLGINKITRFLKKWIITLLIWTIKTYQALFSPLLPPSCRFYPSCSHYAIEALEKRGVLIGLLKIVFRIIRCNPFSKGGYDPV